MIITIRRTGGPAGTDEVLGPVDAAHFDAGVRQRLAAQIEALVDLASSHEPCAAEELRFEVEVLGPGHVSTFLVLEDAGDPAHPTARALADLARTLGLPAPAAGAMS